jgi:hypothetical protein
MLPIKHLHQLRNVASKRVRQSDEHCQAWQRGAALHVADERVVRLDQGRELLLSQASREAKLAQMPAEDDAIALPFRHRKSAASP